MSDDLVKLDKACTLLGDLLTDVYSLMEEAYGPAITEKAFKMVTQGPKEEEEEDKYCPECQKDEEIFKENLKYIRELIAKFEKL